ncbi:MAG TPA: pyruvate, phosphate dikinase, partial [Acidimicrobiia bacterium]|nr:pyruvate, phosphate dikinase [Acidimicrobiia bacterium]
ATGEKRPYGDFLPNAQGEDVVAGIRVTESLDSMAQHFPEPHAHLLDVMSLLEQHYRDMCDIEFTVEQGRLFMLQVRVGKRTAAAALEMAVDMQQEGLIDEREAVLRIAPEQLDQLLHPQFDPAVKYDAITKGLNASPGAAVGKAYFTPDEAEARHAAGEQVILVRPETSPDDIHGMIASEGILTSRGGLASHAALVARGWGKPAVCGAHELDIDIAAGSFTVNGTTVHQGDVISINGTTGEVVIGAVALIQPDELSGVFEKVLQWADEFRLLEVRANADTPDDAAVGRRFGAEGIGLCRTEHMFLGERLPIVQRFILAADEAEEDAALDDLAKLQRSDFEGIFEAMDGLPVTIRLLDPPLHEFLPDIDELLVQDARGQLDAEARRLLAAAQQWREANPMLGTRGVRLGIIKPGLYRMQTKAILEAALARKRAGGDPRVEIMIPLTVTEPELELVTSWVREVAAETFAAADDGDVEYLVGTMVETPRAALDAGEIAEVAEFFSFGTNDLTQMTFGFSRDDVEGRLMAEYLDLKLLRANPFETLDRDGVGQLVRVAVERGRETRPDLHLGICGEHGGDPPSVAFFAEVGLDYVSCSPYRVPIARLAAAHAALGAGGPGDTA